MPYTRIALALIVAACADRRAVEEGDESTTPEPIKVEGVWDGDAWCEDAEFSIELTLIQDGASVTGVGTLDWYFWQFVADVDAMAGEKDLAGLLVSEDVEMEFEAEIDAATMNGSIFVDTMVCAAPVVFTAELEPDRP